ncbi:MAG: Type pilus biosis and competence protein pilQ precursor [Pseudomonadota bacterium]|jgi:Flp pilus assembly secretin CpaC
MSKPFSDTPHVPPTLRFVRDEALRRAARLFACLLAVCMGTVDASNLNETRPDPVVHGASPVLPVSLASDSEPQILSLYVGQAHLIREGPLRRIAVGNGRVLQATSIDDRQLLIIPEAPGQSTVHIWRQEGGERSFVVHVIPADAGRLLTEIRAMLGDQPNLSTRVVGDKLVIEGEGVSDEQASRIAQISARYPQIVNLVSRVGLERMIEMDVRMIEIRRDALENLGVKWQGPMQGPSFGLMGDLKRSAAFQPGGLGDAAGLALRSSVSPFATALGIAGSISSVINLLVQNGDAVVLAEPRLACRSGGSARFVAGGELPIPYSGGFGSNSIAFKEYGVRFEVAPVAGANGVIAARLATEISSVDFEVQVNNVPGITKRRAETEVNLREHQTLVIAGLLSEETSRNVDRMPALGDLPILGRLFRSRLYRDRKTELVVFVTPRFVNPDPHLARAQALEQRNAAMTTRRQLMMVD